MNLERYFDDTKGLGVLSTADSSGKVNAAVYARPHIMEDGTLMFIMRDRLTHENLKSNPHAAYLFKEDRPGYTGKRFYLTKVKEEQNDELMKSFQRRKYSEESLEERFLVFFRLDKELPLVGE
jgi:hypothetical protein